MTTPYGMFNWDDLTPKTSIADAISGHTANMPKVFDNMYQPHISKIIDATTKAQAAPALKLHGAIANSPAMLGAKAGIDWAALTANHLFPITYATETLRDLAGPIPGLADVYGKDIPGLMGFGNVATQLSAQINHPALFAKIHGVATELAFPTSITERLGAKLSTFKVSSWETAANIAISMPEVRKVAQEVVESRPEVAEELTETVTRTGLPTWGELTKSQKIGMVEKSGQSVSSVIIAGLSVPSAELMLLTIILAMVWLAVGTYQIETEVIENRK